MNRSEKLEQLKSETKHGRGRLIKAEVDAKITPDIEALEAVLDGTITKMQKTIDGGVEIADLGILLKKFDSITELSEAVGLLKESISSFPEMPQEVKIASVNELLDAIKDIKINIPEIKVPAQKGLPQPDYSGAVKQMSDALVRVSDSIKAIATKTHSQRADDYVPYRRVVKKGNSLVFDDQPTAQAGGGGGSTTPSRKNTAGDVYVPVANADGSTIGGNGLIPGTDFNYIDGQQTSSTVDTFVYKLGGSGGTTVRTIVVTYTSSAKTDIDTVEYS